MRKNFFTLLASVKHPGFTYGMMCVLACQPQMAQAKLLTGYEDETYTPHAVGNVFEPMPENVSDDFSSVSGSVEIGQDVAEQGSPVDLVADTLTHDDDTKIITASGDVFLTQDDRILRADEISYNLQKDKVVAKGHVVLSEANGDIHYSEYVELNEKLKNGFVNGLQSYMNNGGRFTAVKGQRKDGKKIIMTGAAYTPCDPCKKNPEKAPLWQIRASKVIHDEDEHRISYRNARFELMGVPVLYTPYFSHPDGTIKRKSGLLSPSGGFKSDLGAYVENSYYLNIAPDKDATLGLMVMTEQSPLLFGQWRQRWDSASLILDGAITNSSRTSKSGTTEIKEDEETRGHVFAKALWDMNDKWRSGANVQWVSDDQYMRQYDFTDDDVLEREVYTERFSGRDYASARLISFQDIRVREEQEDQPNVLPEITASFIGEPGSVPVMKGRFDFEASALGLQRGGDNQDMQRLSLNAGWNRRLVSSYGLLTTVDGTVRTDFYHTTDRDVSVAGADRETSKSRFFPSVHVQSSYPVVKQFDTMQMTISPIVALTVAQNIDVSDDIPNEDSQDVQIDAGNLFEANRFPGLDRVEDSSRVTYGLRTGLYGFDGSYGDIFVGQSHRLNNDDNPFPAGSGLDKQDSDIVGQISVQYKDKYNLDYRFQMASDNMASQRHEIDASADWNRFSLGTRYLFAKALEGTSIDESREQLQMSAAYYLTQDWRTRFGATQDMGEDPGLRQAYFGVDHFGQCVSWSLLGVRNYTTDSSGESDTEVTFRVGLKSLGGYETSTFRPEKVESSVEVTPPGTQLPY